MPEDILSEIYDKVEKIPPLSFVAIRVVKMLENPDIAASELIKVVSVDQALTANILKLCNSAYYGLPRTVSSVGQAIMYLGFNVVRNLALTISLKDAFDQTKEGFGYEHGGLWKHSICTAIGAEILSKRLSSGIADVAFTAGLLHDLGKLIVARFLTDRIPIIDQMVIEKSISYREAEREVLGCDHAEIGFKISDAWNFPSVLVQAMGFHHEPEKARGRPTLTVVTHIADIAALKLGLGVKSTALLEPLSEYAKKITGFKDEHLHLLMESIVKELEEPTRFGMEGAISTVLKSPQEEQK